MKNWEGAAAVCFNRKGEVLLVFQGTPEEVKKWALPSGGREGNESFEECCIREVFEETGYEVKVINKIFQKDTIVEGYNVHLPYFLVEVIGGKLSINDPDDVIHAVGWMSIDRLDKLEFSFPEDKALIREFAEKVK